MRRANPIAVAPYDLVRAVFNEGLTTASRRPLSLHLGRLYQACLEMAKGRPGPLEQDRSGGGDQSPLDIRGRSESNH